MSYIGNTQQNQNYFPAVDFFSGNGSTTAFTLSRPVATTAAIQVIVANVAQNPSSAYTVNGNTITFTSAPPSGTNNIYVYYTSPNNTVIQPSDGTVQTASIATGAVTGSKLASSGLSASAMTTGTLPKAQLPTGTVLQVVSTEYSTSMSTSSTTTVDTGLSLSITPSSATSKILVLVSQSITPPTAGSATYGIVEVLRNSTIIVQDNRANNYVQYNHNTWACCKLDSPATTSTITYKTRIATGSAGYSIEAQHASLRPSQITLMEIAV